jgi:hypothetical protein
MKATFNPYQLFEFPPQTSFHSKLYPPSFYPQDFQDLESWLVLCETVANRYSSIQSNSVEILVEMYHDEELTNYLGSIYTPRPFQTVTLQINNNLVMSLTPLEMQSHVNPIQWAHGQVLIGGLGLGYFLNQIKDKPDVEKIIVIEENKDVIRAYQELFPKHPKITIIHENLFNFQPQSKESVFDFFYADIWASFSFQKVMQDIDTLIHQIPCKSWAFWGLELYIYEEYLKSRIPFTTFLKKLNLSWMAIDVLNFIRALKFNRKISTKN